MTNNEQWFVWEFLFDSLNMIQEWVDVLLHIVDLNPFALTVSMADMIMTEHNKSSPDSRPE